MAGPSGVALANLKREFAFNTPFWAGGATKDASGVWHQPAPDARFQGCVKILNKQRKLVHLHPHPWQLEFDDLLEAQRAKGQPMRAIILKARKLGFCCAPETRVLTADMKWLTLDEIQPGQRVVSTDECVPGGRGRGRKMRVGVVEAKREVREEAFLIRLDNGQSLTATGPHRWLCRQRGGTEAVWRTVADMRPGDYVRHVAEPWGPGDFDDGWFGGLIDGEGSLRAKPAGGGGLTICQRPGDVFDRAGDYLRHRGYTFREVVEVRPDGTNKKAGETFLGRLDVERTNELFRLIGQARPTRFVNDPSWWANRDLPGKRSGVAWAKVVAIEPLGVRRMIDLQTDHKTFIAEGFVSHNSTWVSMKFLQRLTQMEYQQAIVVAQDTKTAGEIFDMAKRAHQHLPTIEELGLGFNLRPEIIGANFSRDGRKFMEFGEASRRLRENGRTGSSVFEIDTAGSPEAGRGYTPSMLHLSEVARWEGEQANRKMLGMLNAMPQEPETIVVLESTANGLNHFYRRWVSAREGAKDPDTGENYVALFVPWQRDPLCAKQFENDEQRERFTIGIGDTKRYGEQAEDEPMLVEAYGCTPEQLFWRRMMIRTQHEGRVELFDQENPHSDEAAFIGSGRTVFSGVHIAKAIKQADRAPEPVAGTLAAGDMRERRSRSGTIRVPSEALWVPAEAMKDGDLLLEVWEHPKKATDEWPDGTPQEERVDGAYVVAVDVAEGEANTFTQGDSHAIQVFDHRTHEQVAVHESRVDVHELPVFAMLVALYYNRAWLAVEINGPGIAVLDPLARDYRYQRLFRRERVDAATKERVRKPGWKTDGVSKPVMESTFAAALQDGTHGIRDLRTARQLSTYIITERGKHEAQHGEHDDRLVAAMIAHRVMEVLTPPRSNRRRRTGDWVPQDDITGW